jgi:hypothetical protein
MVPDETVFTSKWPFLGRPSVTCFGRRLTAEWPRFVCAKGTLNVPVFVVTCWWKLTYKLENQDSNLDALLPRGIGVTLR